MNLLQKVPRALQSWLHDTAIEEIREGMSGTSVFRLERHDQPSRYLKIAARYSDQDLHAEVSRLIWLHGRLPVPEVLYWAEDAERQYLIISAVPGMALYDESIRDQLPALIRLYASGLRQIHDVQGCPFDHRLDVKIARAADRLQANKIDTEDFDAERQGRTAKSVFRELLATRPDAEDLVFTHGDYCTPNVLVDPDALSVTGFIDWGRAGIADRYQDLALAARSIEYNFGAGWIESFFAAYGISEIDHTKVRFYRLLDEFF